MSVLFLEGFETSGTELGLVNQATTRPRIAKRFDSVGAGGSPATDSFFLIEGELGDFACAMGSSAFSGGNFLKWVVPDELQEAPGAQTWAVSQRVHIPSAARTFTPLFIEGKLVGLSTAFEVRVENSTDIVIRRGAALTQVVRVDDILTPGWHHLETRFQVSDTAALEVRLNGTPIIDNTYDLNDFLTIGVAAFTFFGSVASTDPGDFTAYDDLAVVESPTQWLGDGARVTRLDLDADAAANWAPSAPGSHFELIDENGNDESDFIESDHGSALFSFTDLPLDRIVFGMKVEAEAKSDTPGQSLAVRAEVDGIVSEAVHELTSTYDVYSLIVHDGLTKETIDSAVAGVRHAT
jgi:hypothetical protein